VRRWRPGHGHGDRAPLTSLLPVAHPDADLEGNLTDWRRFRRQKRTAEVHWIDVLYQAYLTAIVGIVAVAVLSSVVGDDPLSARQLAQVRAHGPGWVGAAAALAVALGAEKLVVLTDVAGLYADAADPSTLISSITVDDVEALLPVLSAGMSPKMEACARAVRGGVAATHVLDGRVPHVLLLEVFTDDGVGTMVTP